MPDLAENRLDEKDFRKRYERLKLLGRGSFGEVHLARQQPLGRLVAVKVMLAGNRSWNSVELDRFMREAQLLARVHHPGIVTIHDLGTVGDRPFLVMEYLDGQDLRARLERDRKLTAEETVRIGLRVAEVLEHLHREEILHRDLKPGNVLLGSEGQVKVTDFGIARPLEPVEALTEEGMMLGTPQYMAPEMIRDARADFASDVHALGIVMYECCHGHFPFEEGNDIGDLLRRKVEEAPWDPAPDIPDPLARVLRLCLELDATDRPQAFRVREMLEQARVSDLSPRIARPTAMRAAETGAGPKISGTTGGQGAPETRGPEPAPAIPPRTTAPLVEKPGSTSGLPAGRGQVVDARGAVAGSPSSVPLGVLLAFVLAILGGGFLAVMMSRQAAPLSPPGGSPIEPAPLDLPEPKPVTGATQAADSPGETRPLVPASPAIPLLNHLAMAAAREKLDFETRYGEHKEEKFGHWMDRAGIHPLARVARDLTEQLGSLRLPDEGLAVRLMPLLTYRLIDNRYRVYGEEPPEGLAGPADHLFPFIEGRPRDTELLTMAAGTPCPIPVKAVDVLDLALRTQLPRLAFTPPSLSGRLDRLMWWVLQVEGLPHRYVLDLQVETADGPRIFPFLLARGTAEDMVESYDGWLAMGFDPRLMASVRPGLQIAFMPHRGPADRKPRLLRVELRQQQR